MSALAEALVAAQRRAIAQLEKEYVRSRQEDDDERAEGMRDALAAIGLPDRTDADALINCLEVLRVTGGALPSEPTNGATKEAGPMTDAQATYIDKLWTERGGRPGDEPILTGLTKDSASKLITQLKTDTYNVADWDIPF